MSDIGRLTTPSGEGGYIEVDNAGIIINHEIQVNDRVICKRTNLSDLTLVGGNTNYGAALVLYGSEQNKEHGAFQLCAQSIEPNEFTNESGRIWLSGKTNNELRWNNKLIDSIHSFGDNYIQYTNGLAICWGTNIRSRQSITYPVSFISYPSTTYGFSSSSTAYRHIQGHNSSTTGFTMAIYDENNNLLTNTDNVTSEYLAIGRWK